MFDTSGTTEAQRKQLVEQLFFAPSVEAVLEILGKLPMSAQQIDAVVGIFGMLATLKREHGAGETGVDVLKQAATNGDEGAKSMLAFIFGGSQH